MSRALIAMSGGVDSAVAALLTKQAGFDCVGCTMKLHGDAAEEADPGKSCCTLADVEDARAVAMRLGMPYYVFNFERDFEEKIVKKFAESYLAGITPNPCIDCNRFMKFEKLYERAMALGCAYVVTGHYARIEEKNGRFLLKRGLDPAKDQSYVLYAMTQEQLSRTRFPLGALTKTETRRIAAENGFVNADKPDSQDICFVPDGDYAAVIERVTGKPAVPGDFIDAAGNVLGRHKGVIHYTIGQRRGLGVPAKQSYYVTAIDPAANTVTLSFGEGLFSDTVQVRDANYIAAPSLEPGQRVEAKIRYRHPAQPATVLAASEDAFTLRFDVPQRAVTKGQAAVLYDGDVVLAGGTIN